MEFLRDKGGPVSPDPVGLLLARGPRGPMGGGPPAEEAPFLPKKAPPPHTAGLKMRGLFWTKLPDDLKNPQRPYVYPKVDLDNPPPQAPGWVVELRVRGLSDEASLDRLQATLAQARGERLDAPTDPLLVVMLCGPTAVGKTAVAIATARPASIISRARG